MLARPTNKNTGVRNTTMHDGPRSNNDYGGKQEVNQMMRDEPRMRTGPNVIKEVPSSVYFPQRLFRMLNEIENLADKRFLADVVSWHPSGSAFVIHKPKEFVSAVMPIYFSTQSKLMSFKRQLNNYGFQRIKGQKYCAGTLVFYHKDFIRNQPFRCEEIQLKAKLRVQDITTTPAKPISNPDTNRSSSLAVQLLPGMFPSSMTSTAFSSKATVCYSSCWNQGEDQRKLSSHQQNEAYYDAGITCSGAWQQEGDCVLDQAVMEILQDDDSLTVSDQDEQSLFDSCSRSFHSGENDNPKSWASLNATNKTPSLLEAFLAHTDWDPDVESLERLEKI